MEFLVRSSPLKTTLWKEATRDFSQIPQSVYMNKKEFKNLMFYMTIRSSMEPSRAIIWNRSCLCRTRNLLVTTAFLMKLVVCDNL